jgi:trans-aconitate 2-methyltransferase
MAPDVPDPVALNVLRPEQYAKLLHALGFVEQHVRLQVYGHTLGWSGDVVEWVKGTSLTRFTNVLPADLHAEFLATYEQRLLERIGDRAPYFYPFKRILFWGLR